jgi:integration host factor subunit alpha
MALTKAKLINSMNQKVLLSKNDTSETVEILLDIVKKTLESGEEIMISGFGKFSVREKKPRNGRNPVTGEPMVLRARKVVTFKCSKKLVEKLNA